jgi:hypothetical protein
MGAVEGGYLVRFGSGCTWDPFRSCKLGKRAITSGGMWEGGCDGEKHSGERRRDVKFGRKVVRSERKGRDDRFVSERFIIDNL